MVHKKYQFNLTNPIQYGDSYESTLVADPDAIDYALSKPYILSAEKFNIKRVVIVFDPCYDIDDVWLDLYYELKDFYNREELDKMWYDALKE